MIAIALAPFAPSVGYGFALDDANYIQGNRGVVGPLSFEDVFLRDSWGRSQFDTIGHWRPLGTLTFWVDQRVGGGMPWAFHLTNLLLYATLLFAIDRFLRSWGEGALSERGRHLAVLVFGLLTVHVDVVPSLAGRAELLAAIFSLGCVAALVRPRPLRLVDVALASGALFLALLSKETAAPMAVLAPILAHRSSAGRYRVPTWTWVALVVGTMGVLAAVVTFRVFRMPFVRLGPERALENSLLSENTPRRILGAFDVLGLYLRHIATGEGLVPDYSFSEPPILRNGMAGIALGAAFLLACAGVAIASWNRSPRIADALIALAASYFPMSSFALPAPGVADRFVFFPTVWLVAALAMILDARARTHAARAAVAVGALAFAALQAVHTVAYAATWRDDVTLLHAATRVYPNIFRAQRNLAHALADAGNLEDAAWHLTIAEAIYRHYPVAVGRDVIGRDWEDEPLSARLDHLQAVFGKQATCDAVRTAAARLRSWAEAPTSEPLAGWARRVDCAPP